MKKGILTKKEQAELLGGIIGVSFALEVASDARVNNTNRDSGCKCTCNNKQRVANNNLSTDKCICVCN
jgi:hypothetical protein